MLFGLQSPATPTIHTRQTSQTSVKPEQTVPVKSLASDQSFGKKEILVGSFIAGGLISIFFLISMVKPHTQSSIQTEVSPSVQLLIPRTGDNYSWLSQRKVTDGDLDGKDGLQLDIMRNSIFARHGRRFDTPELQKYFNSQLWYHPSLYSPSEFDQLNLLSDLELQNVEYINVYQNNHNKRRFPK